MAPEGLAVRAAAVADAHAYYAGVGEATMYVERNARRSGIGSALIDAIAAAGPEVGYHKLVGKVFVVELLVGAAAE